MGCEDFQAFILFDLPPTPDAMLQIDCRCWSCEMRPLFLPETWHEHAHTYYILLLSERNSFLPI